MCPAAPRPAPIVRPVAPAVKTGRPRFPWRALRRVGKGVRENVMECHEVSCFVMVRSPVRPARPTCGGGREALRQRRRRFWRGSVSVIIHASFQAKQRAGRVSLFCAPFACAGVRGRGRAYRGGAARAPDCPRETARRTSPVRSRRGLFRGPQPSLSAEKPKGGPGSRLSLLSFYTIPPNVKPAGKNYFKE